MELVDPMPLHPLLRHPHTGEPLRAIFQLEDGEYVWPFFGSDGEGDEGGEDEGENNDDSEDEDEEEDTGEDGADDKSKSKKESKSESVSREEFDRLKKRMQAADRAKTDAVKKAEEYERKDKTELQNAQADLKKVTEQHTKLQGSFTNLARTNAFLIASQQANIAWHNPKVAQKAADLEELEVDEDGNVDGIEAAVKKLAKDQPYLVNKGKASDEEDEDDGDKGTKRGASGSGVGSTKTPKGKKNNGKLSDEQLKARFPALR